MTDHFRIFGYEWGLDCPWCGEFNNLSGMGLASDVSVNDENTARTRALEPDDVVMCGECGETFQVVAKSVTDDV